MDKEKEMPGYMTYREAALIFSLMPDDEAAQAIKATVNYFLYGDEPGNRLAGTAARVFEIMCAGIDRDRDKYRRTLERNRQNGLRGGRPSRK